MDFVFNSPLGTFHQMRASTANFSSVFVFSVCQLALVWVILVWLEENVGSHFRTGSFFEFPWLPHMYTFRRCFVVVHLPYY